MEELAAIEKEKSLLVIKEQLALEKALSSSDPEEIYKAQIALSKKQKAPKPDRKSFFVDPQQFNSSFGYKDKHIAISYGMLRAMAKTPIINAIIRTRINQVAAFAEPQKDEFSVGFKIRKKKIVGSNGDYNLSLEEEKEIQRITDFINNCGDSNIWGGDDFDSFIRKITRDSLTFDQMNFEVIYDLNKKPKQFIAVDAATCRIAEDYDSSKYQDGEVVAERIPEKVNGYYPSTVQIYNDRVVAEFYPWEMCFGLRNPSTNFYNPGYGISELEELVSIITSLLWGEEYNRQFFKQGSAPKGILKVSGSFGDTRLQEFRQQWNATMRGVSNAWKTPVLESDKVEWIDLQRTNRDMEFTNWIEFLIKISCAVYVIDPAEVNFPLQGGANGGALFEGNNEARIKYSRDKGLYPLLKFIQWRLNKWVVQQLNPDYEFVFIGLDSMSAKEQAEYDSLLLSTTRSLSEVRAMRGLKPAKERAKPLDTVLNPNLIQLINAQSVQQGMFSSEGGEGGEGGEEETMSQDDKDSEFFLDEEEVKKGKDSNPFVDSLNNYLRKINQ